MTKYTRVKMKLDDGEVIEFFDVAYDETGIHTVFIMKDRIFSVATHKIVWTLLTV